MASYATDQVDNLIMSYPLLATQYSTSAWYLHHIVEHSGDLDPATHSLVQKFIGQRYAAALNQQLNEVAAFRFEACLCDDCCDNVSHGFGVVPH